MVKSVAAMGQLMIVRRGQTERYRSLQNTFGDAPINAKVIWDRREQNRRRQGAAADEERRRRDRRAPLPSTWASLDFVVAKPGTVTDSAPPPTPEDRPHPIDRDVLVRRELSARGPCTVSRVPEGVQGLYGLYEEAVRQGEALAEQEQSDLWYTEDHETFTLVRSFRRSTRSA